MIDELIEQAESVGCLVRWHRGGPKGAWLPPDTISLRYGLDDVQTVCALAHELGHVMHGDGPGCHEVQERRADEWAAKRLIRRDDYARVEEIYTHDADMARELGVTMHLLRVWKQVQERILA